MEHKHHKHKKHKSDHSKGDNSDGDDNMEHKHQKQKKHKRNHSMGDNSDDNDKMECKHKHKKHKRDHSMGDNSDENESWSVYRKRREDYYKGKEKIGHSENKRHSGSSWFQKDDHMELRFQSGSHDDKYEKSKHRRDYDVMKTRCSDSDEYSPNRKTISRKHGKNAVLHEESYRKDPDSVTVEKTSKGNDHKKTHGSARDKYYGSNTSDGKLKYETESTDEKICIEAQKVYSDEGEREEDLDFSFDFLQYRSDLNKIFFRHDEFVKR